MCLVYELPIAPATSPLRLSASAKGLLGLIYYLDFNHGVSRRKDDFRIKNPVFLGNEPGDKHRGACISAHLPVCVR